MYKFLKPSDDNLLVSSVADVNGVEKHIFNLANSSTEFYTEPVGFLTAHHVHHRIVAEEAPVGTTTATLQTSLDGIIWFDTEDADSNSVTFTVDPSLDTVLYHDVYAFGNFQRWKFTGANSGGQLSIQTLVK